LDKGLGKNGPLGSSFHRALSGAVGRAAAGPAHDLVARRHNVPNSEIGTFETCRRALRMSVDQGQTGRGRPTAKTTLLTLNGPRDNLGSLRLSFESEGTTRGEGIIGAAAAVAIQWDEAFTVTSFFWPLMASRSSSAEKGLIRTETPWAEIETTVCDLMSPVITMAGTFRPRAARR
jgi:hypothetical protein